MNPKRNCTQFGHTLLEMLAAVTIVGLIATVAMPRSASDNQQGLDLAARELAGALRYARDQARRTGDLHGVAIDVSGDQLSVFRLDEAPNPNLRVFDVYHPVTKHLYVIGLDAIPYRDVKITDFGGELSGACSEAGNIAFDSDGVVRCIEPVATRIENAFVELTAGARAVSVSVDVYTGRVTVQ